MSLRNKGSLQIFYFKYFIGNWQKNDLLQFQAGLVYSFSRYLTIIIFSIKGHNVGGNRQNTVNNPDQEEYQHRYAQIQYVIGMQSLFFKGFRGYDLWYLSLQWHLSFQFSFAFPPITY